MANVTMTAHNSFQTMKWPWLSIHLLMHSLAAIGLMYFSLTNLLLMISVHYFIALFGLTLGYHRLISHRSYHAPRWFEFIVAFIGLLAFQGGPRFWATVHRAHHAHTDKHGDAHAASKGFLWSHQAWLFFQEPNGFSIVSNRSKVRDITSSTYLMFLENNFFTLNIILACICLMILPLAIWFWVFPVRIVFTWHTTWLINSAAHNQLPFMKRQHEPRNTWWINLLACGEGLHKNHHNEPNSPSFEKNEHDFDCGYRMLKLLSYLHIIKLSKPNYAAR